MSEQLKLPLNLEATEVFTPNSSPRYTYVQRPELQLEKILADSLAIKNVAVSISGPSKSGKTVLTKKVLNPDYLIKVNGASIRTAEDVWNQVLRWMDVPSSVTTGKQSSLSIGAKANAKGSLGIPLVTKGEVGGEGNINRSSGNSDSSTTEIHGLEAVIREISDSDFVVFIDDFHYIDRDVQREVGRQIKAAIENGVTVCTASVPHSNDDVVRANPELRGRLAAIDIGYWSEGDLELIAKSGFPALNIEIAKSVIKRLARESLGSPQIMQSLCLNLCFVVGVGERLKELTRIDVNSEHIKEIFKRTSTLSDWSSLVSEIHSGPRQRGTERKIFDFIDKTKGDVYRAILLSLIQDPARLSLRYDEILTRVRAVCVDEVPVGSSINAALEQIAKLSQDINDGNPIIEWDEDVLDIVEPYLLFYMRGSGKIPRLGTTVSQAG